MSSTLPPVLEAGALPLGLIQGRLSPPSPAGLQAFPWKTWEAEFLHARTLGLNGIEWLVPDDRLADNPIRHRAGRERIRQLVVETGVRVLSVCADYFINHSFLRVTPAEQSESVAILMGLISEARAVGAMTLLVPLVETGRITTDPERDELIACLREPLSLAKSINIRLGLETDLPVVACLELIEKIGHDYARIYYDSGTAASSGYDIAADVRRLGGYMCGVHVRDVEHVSPLFEALHEVGYAGAVILRTAFGTEYLEDARQTLDVVRRHLPPITVLPR